MKKSLELRLVALPTPQGLNSPTVQWFWLNKEKKSEVNFIPVIVSLQSSLELELGVSSLEFEFGVVFLRLDFRLTIEITCVVFVSVTRRF